MPAEFHSERAGFTGVRTLRHGEYLRPQGQITNFRAIFYRALTVKRPKLYNVLDTDETRRRVPVGREFMSQKLLIQVTELQKAYIQKIRTVKKPYHIKIENKNLIILPKVFPPYTDSFLIANVMKIAATDVVMDVCSGSGILALFAADKAAHVIATDISSYSIKNIRLNAVVQNVQDKLRAVKADVFPKEPMAPVDVILFNPPYSDHPAKNLVERTVWDEGHRTVIRFFKNVDKYLKTNGKIYMGWANFADLDYLKNMIKSFGFKSRTVATCREGDSVFFTLKLDRTHKRENLGKIFSANCVGR